MNRLVLILYIVVNVRERMQIMFSARAMRTPTAQSSVHLKTQGSLWALRGNASSGKCVVLKNSYLVPVYPVGCLLTVPTGACPFY